METRIGPRNGKGLYHMPDWRGHYAARPRHHQWANRSMILFLTDLTIAWAVGQGQHGRRAFGLGDISLADGTAPPKHHTHVYGSCVDLYVFHRDGLRRGDGSNIARFDQPETYDLRLTQELAHCVMRVVRRGYRVIQFLYDDPKVRELYPSVITTKATRPHADHFHIQLHEDTPYKGREQEILNQSLLQRRAGF